MKVAIIGAGWSGLCCALELESHQIFSDIYEQQSIENHLAVKLQSPIIFNQYLDYQQLAGKFDKLIIATGQPNWALQKGIWQETVGSWI